MYVCRFLLLPLHPDCDLRISVSNLTALVCDDSSSSYVSYLPSPPFQDDVIIARDDVR